MAGVEGRVALVTGASQGIGRACALELARGGAAVAAAARSRDKLDALVAEIIAAGGKAAAFPMNVAKEDDVKSGVKAAAAHFGKLDILVNNAGITRDNLIMRMKEEDWDLVLDINLKGAFLCSKAALKIMSKARTGRIINIASIVGAMGNAGQANYVASKAGLIGLTKTIAREYASRGITANAVAPGFIDTAMTQALPEKVREDLMKQIPLARLGSPEDIAAAVKFLASDSAAYITGQVIHVNGGMYM